MKLNFGCGNQILKGYDNLDKKDFDFNKFPYPIKDNTYGYILVRCVIEHLIDLHSVFRELQRISKDGAIIEILTTYYNNYTSYNNIEHIHHFNASAFIQLDIKGLKLKKLKLISSKAGFFVPFREFFSRYISGLIKQIYVEFEVKKFKKGDL